MSENNGKAKLFREKSLEAMDSPESLNDYLRVTSPGVWLVLAAVIALLVGGILWGIFGRIDTTRRVAVVTRDGASVCLVPFDNAREMQNILNLKSVTVDGRTYAVTLPESGEVTGGFVYEFFNEEDAGESSLLFKACNVGEMTKEDKVITLPLAEGLKDGVAEGTAVLDTLHPIALLLQ